MKSGAGRAFVRLLLGLGLAVVLTAGALAAWTGRRPAGEPGVSYGPPAAVPLASDKTLGINVDLSRYDREARQEVLSALEKTGFRWLRQRFPWDRIEPEPGVYDWTVWDEIVEDIAGHKISLVAVLDHSPEWARRVSDANNPAAPPVETRDFGAFAAALAGRYGEQIDTYQVWDEPNIAPHWGDRDIDPAGYVRLLREGTIQIRTADPGSIILAAALAPTLEPGGANMSDLLFLDTVYRQGGSEWFDVVAAQPYAFEEPATAPPDGEQLNWKRIALLREVMEEHGDEQTAVWAVSFGLDNDAPEGVVGAVQRAREDWPWLGPMMWAAWSPEDPHGQYAIVDSDNQPKPLREALQLIAVAPVVAWPGVYPGDHPSGHYEGGWRVTPYGADIGQSGDTLTIPFYGTRLDLRVRRGDYRAFLYVRVDGEPGNALPRDMKGQAYLVLYDPLGEADNVVLAQGLPHGQHQAELIAERGWGQWAIVGWMVVREAAPSVPWLAFLLGLAALAVWVSTVYNAVRNVPILLTVSDRLMARCRTLDERLALGLTAGAAVLLYVAVGAVPSLAALALLGTLLLLHPRTGLPLIALSLPFYQLGKPLFGRIFSMVEILTMLTAAAWAVNWLARNLPDARRTTGEGGRALRLSSLDWGVLALVAVGATSLSWAEHLREAAREFRTVILEAALYYGLMRAMVVDERDAWRLADFWMLGAALIGLVALVQWAFGQDLITADDVWRVRGFYGSPNNLALYLGRSLPLGLAMAVWGQPGRRRWAYGLAAVAMGAAIVLSYSRGAWLLGVPVSLLFMAALRGRRAFAVTVALTGLMAMGILVVAGTGRLTSLLDTSGGTTFFRLQLWQSSWAMIREHPVLGVGLDNFLYHYRTRFVLPTAWEEFNLSHPHNVVFDFWLRLGLPGLAVAIWLLVGFFRQGLGVYRASAASQRVGQIADRTGQGVLVLGLMGGMVNAVAHGLVDNAFFLIDLAFAFMLMLALVQTPRRLAWDMQTATNL